MSEKKKPKAVIYRDKRPVAYADRPRHEIVRILARHILPGEDHNPTGETAGAAASAALEWAQKLEDGKKKGGDGKRGKFGPMRAVVNILQPASLDNLLSVLENDNTAADLPERRSLLDLGHRIEIQEVNRQAKKVYYSVNHTEHEISFKTLQNYISMKRRQTIPRC